MARLDGSGSIGKTVQELVGKLEFTTEEIPTFTLFYLRDEITIENERAIVPCV